MKYSGTATQVAILATGLPRDRHVPMVCVLGDKTAAEQDLSAAGVELKYLGWRRLVDPSPIARLRALVRAFRPDVIHVWHGSGLRALLSAAGRGGAKLVASQPLSPGQKGPLVTWLDRRLLGWPDCVIVNGPAEAERCRELGLPAHKLEQVQPGVPLPAGLETESATIRQSLGIPEDVCLVAGIGPLEPHKGYRDSIWVLDILHFLYADLHLMLIGQGCRPAVPRGFCPYCACRGSSASAGRNQPCNRCWRWRMWCGFRVMQIVEFT